MIAALGEDLKTVEALVENGANVDGAHPKTGVTPLMLANGAGHLEAAKFLIRSGADFNRKTETGCTQWI